MNQNDIMYNLFSVFLSFITFFILKVLNCRSEWVVCEFYVALKEKNPRCYVTQRKLVKVVRKFSGLATDMKIHWVYCLGNYLQFIVMISPLILFLFYLIYNSNEIDFKTLNLIYIYCRYLEFYYSNIYCIALL